MAKATPIQQQIADATDMMLLAWLENGIEKFRGIDPNGNPIMTREVLSAAHMAQVIRRLQQLGVTAVPVAGSPAGNLADAARARGIGLKINGKPAMPPLPPISQDKDAATG